MGSDEENLDELLKSLMASEDESEYSEEENIIADSTGAEENAPADFGFAIEENGEEEYPEEEAYDADFGIADSDNEDSDNTDTGIADFGMEEADNVDTDIADFAIEDFGAMEPETNEMEDEIDISLPITDETDISDSDTVNTTADDMAIEDFAIEDFGVIEPEEAMGADDADADDIDAMFAVVDDNSDSNELSADSAAESIDLLNDISDADDMLALLESMSEEEEVSDNAGGERKRGDEASNETANSNSKDNSGKKEKKKGLFSKVFSGKKKNQQENTEEAHEGVLSPEDVPQEKQEWKEIAEELPMDESLENLFGAVEETAADEVAAEKEALPVETPVKSKNIFSRIFAFLTEADDEGENERLRAEHGMAPSAENKNILEELDEEDKKKKKKKIKGKKGQPEEIPEDEDESGEVKDNEKKKDKKKKKKDKPSKDVIDDSLVAAKPGKKISKRNVAIIAGLCLTLTAVIVVLCSIVPGFFDKRKAREAYYQSNYQESYELLYGKKLDNSDSIIFNKSRIVLGLNRKLNSYHNYLSIGKEVQALDALMSGVEKYPEILLEAEEYHVTQEINAIYETILNILNDKYDMSEPVAKVIISYDDLTYTRKLESIVYRTPFVMPEEETTSAADMLPEERLRMEENNTGTQADADNVAEDEAVHVFESSDEAEEFPTGNTAGVSDGSFAQNDSESSQDGNLPENTAEEAESSNLAGTNTASNEVSTGATQDSSASSGESAGAVQGRSASSEESTSGSSTSGSQGQLIQGVKQPLDIEIRGN